MEHRYKLVVEKTTEYHFDISSNDVDDIQTKEEIIELIINKKYENMDHIKLIENIEKFISAIDGNANFRLSLMNMIINSNKALN